MKPSPQEPAGDRPGSSLTPGIPALRDPLVNRRRFSHRQVAALLALFAAVFIGLCLGGYTRTSATYDESINLLSGYAILQHHDYRFAPDHVPFTRIWAAIPLLFMRIVSYNPAALPDTSSLDWVGWQQVELARQFMYQWNDADHLLYAARFMMLLLGVALGIMVFFWARELLGDWPAVVALSLYALNPNILAHAPLVTADLGLACFLFGAAWFLWRSMRVLSPGNLAGLGLCTALLLVSKFWGLVFLPLVPACLLVRAWNPKPWPCRLGRFQELVSASSRFLAVAVVSLTVFAASYGGIWAAYRFQYRPCASSSDQLRFDQGPFVQARASQLAVALSWVDRAHLLPNAFTQGLLYGSANLQSHLAFLAGRYSQVGWWYYFPVAFLIKSPLVLLLLLLAGALRGLARFRPLWRDSLPLWLSPLAFFLVAMCGNVNIGLRHLLLVYPFAALLAACPLAASLSRRRPWTFPVVILLAAAELASAYPHCLAFFNCLVGGPARGCQYLVDSNLDWGQDLKGLKRWMDSHGVNHINLAYFGTADPAYYHISSTPLLTGPFSAVRGAGQDPRLPGYVAVSVTNLRGVYLDDLGRAFYRPLLDRTPVAAIGHSIHIYWMDRPWLDEALLHLQAVAAAQPDNARIHTQLAALLSQLGRQPEALRHYAEAVRLSPEDGEAHYNLGNALFRQGSVPEAIEQYQHALQLMPDFAKAHYNLGVAFSRFGRPPEAIEQFEQAVRCAERASELMTNSVATYLDALGVAYSEAGRFSEAVQAAGRGAALARAAGNNDQAAQIESRLQSYQAGRPYHETTTPKP